jgi:hypothetical protein
MQGAAREATARLSPAEKRQRAQQKKQPQRMKKFLLHNRLYLIGAALGAMAGYGYWYYIGCASATCAITSKPLNSTLYFSIMGSVFAGLFQRPQKATIQ